MTTSQRWGPAFGGIHTFTGIDSLAGGKSLPTMFIEEILSVNGFAQAISNAWFNASDAASSGSFAIMGPITVGGVSDVNDYSIGQSTIGHTFSSSAITGWLYMHQ